MVSTPNQNYRIRILHILGRNLKITLDRQLFFRKLFVPQNIGGMFQRLADFLVLDPTVTARLLSLMYVCLEVPAGCENRIGPESQIVCLILFGQ